MRTKLLALFVGVAIGTATILGVGIAQADKPTTTSMPHVHFMDVNGELVMIGPNVCDHEFSEQGWVAFHQKVHIGVFGGPGLATILCSDWEG
jgi:hypothetical protein